MTGTRISSEGLDERRRRLLFRSWHRGIREMDLVLGRFADAHIASLSEAELDEYEALARRCPTSKFSPGSTARKPRPPRSTARCSASCARFISATRQRMTKSPAQLLRAGRPLTLAQVADGAEGLVLADLARAIAAGERAPAISLAVICRDGQRMAGVVARARHSSGRTSRRWNSRPGIACLMTACRRTRRWWRSA